MTTIFGRADNSERVEGILANYREHEKMHADSILYIAGHSVADWEITKTMATARSRRPYFIREYSGCTLTREWKRLKSQLVQTYGAK